MTTAIIAILIELIANTPNVYNTESKIPFVGRTLIKVIILITKGIRQEHNKSNLNIIFVWFTTILKMAA